MRRLRPLAVLLAVMVTASFPLACTSHPSGSGATQDGSADAAATELKRFYGQALSWATCPTFATTPEDKKAYADPSLQCAYLEVPLDYAKPNDRTSKIGLLRRPASDPLQRIGSLVVNPGGPGASGMSAAANLVDRIKDNELGQRFDLVGFDPRGVGATQPQVRCLTPPERDAERLMNLGVDTSPTGVARTESQERIEDAECASRTGADVLAHVGTREVARDLDLIRAALGDTKLNYLGYSYGTSIGTRYAEDFPHNVRAMILDGAIDPAQDPIAERIDQGRGFQQAFDMFSAWCAGRTDCALGKDPGQAVNAFHALVLPLITQPVEVSDGRQLSYTDATTGTVQALYLPALWIPLNRGLQELAQGHGDILIRLADVYYGRSPDGTYSTQIDTFQAVTCVDHPPITDRNVARDADAKFRAVAPFLDDGRPPSPALDNCAFWPVPPTSRPHRPQISGLPTVMVISTTHDPATPYQAGVNLAHELNGRLLTFEGTQHTAFLHGIDCVDRAGISYLTTLQPPREEFRCQAAT